MCHITPQHLVVLNNIFFFLKGLLIAWTQLFSFHLESQTVADSAWNRNPWLYTSLRLHSYVRHLSPPPHWLLFHQSRTLGVLTLWHENRKNKLLYQLKTLPRTDRLISLVLIAVTGSQTYWKVHWRVHSWWVSGKIT